MCNIYIILYIKERGRFELVKNKELTDKEAREIGLRLREIREATGMQQNDFAKLFSIEPTVYNRYELGRIKRMSNSKLWLICRKYNIEVGWLLGFESYDKYRKPDISPKDYKPIGILGTIAAGIPIEAQEDIQGYEYVPKDFHADFCLRVKGDSMIGARILDGDIVYIRKQPMVENGEIAAVIIDNEDATLKKFYMINGTIILRSENPKYQEMIYQKKDGIEITVIGKAVSFRSEVR